MNDKKKAWNISIMLLLILGIVGVRISHAYFGHRKLLPMRDLIEDADLILVGSAIHFTQNEMGEYSAWTVRVADVLKGSIPIATGGKNTPDEVAILEEMPFTDSTGILALHGKDLLFLKAVAPDAALPANSGLDASSTYRLSHGWQGVFNLFAPLGEKRRKDLQSKEKKYPRSPQEVRLKQQFGLTSTDDYMAAIKRFLATMKMEKVMRKKELLKLLKMKEAVYEKSAITELREIGVVVEKVAGEYEVISDGQGQGQGKHLQGIAPTKGGIAAPKQKKRGTKRARKAHGPGKEEKK